jgi:hypothetical protein
VPAGKYSGLSSGGGCDRCTDRHSIIADTVADCAVILHRERQVREPGALGDRHNDFGRALGDLIRVVIAEARGNCTLSPEDAGDG